MTSGQKVVCVNGRFPDWVKVLYRQLPSEGVTYTVRDVRPGHKPLNHGKFAPVLAVTLVELVNPPDAKFGDELAFDSDRFAPTDPPEDLAAGESLEEALVLPDGGNPWKEDYGHA